VTSALLTTMEILKWHPEPSQQEQEQFNDEDPKIMELDDENSNESQAPQPKTGARRGRPRLTEDSELAKQVAREGGFDRRNDARNYVMRRGD
jgi:hypothetical protein